MVCPLLFLAIIWVNYLKWRNSSYVLLLRWPHPRYNCSMNFLHFPSISKLHIPNFLWIVNLLLSKKNPKIAIFSPQCKWCLLMSAAQDQSSPFWSRNSPYLNWTVRASTWETRPVRPSWQPLHTRYLLSLSTVVQLVRRVLSHFTYYFIKARKNLRGIASKRLPFVLSNSLHQSFWTRFCACCLPSNEKLLFYLLNLVNFILKVCVLKLTFL